MSLLPSVFKAQDHDSMSDYSVVPPNEYIAQIIKSEIKPTKKALEDPDGPNGKDCRLNFQFKILEGDYKGRLVFAGLNIVNANPTAQEMAGKELRTICNAVGKAQVQDSQELHGIPMKIKVKVEPATAQYAEKNVITYYEAIGASSSNISEENPFEDDEG